VATVMIPTYPANRRPASPLLMYMSEPKIYRSGDVSTSRQACFVAELNCADVYCPPYACICKKGFPRLSLGILLSQVGAAN